MRAKHFLPTLFLLGLMVACSYNELPVELPLLEVAEEESLNVETRAETYDGKALDQEYFVTAADLENYVRYRRGTSKRSTFSVKEVKSYGFDSSQTLFYILNFDKGWEVVAADKRVQASLAYGDSGEFTMDCDNEPMKFWMNMLADGVLQTRSNKDVDTSSFSAAEKSDLEERRKANVDFWNSISLTKQNSEGTRLIPIIGPVENIIGGLYHYVVDVETTTEVVQYGPLLETKWGQHFPWNIYCPLKSGGTTERAPAGCVPVAAAQMLYYLQDHYNITDAYIPTTAVCQGSVNGYVRFFDNYSNTAWSNMACSYVGYVDATPQEQATAILIAYMGSLLGSELTYGNNGTRSDMMKLPDYVFDKFGITCSSTTDYDSDIIIENIKDELPVMLRGAESLLFGSGHAWIADGYKRTTTTTVVYTATFSSPQTQPFIDMLTREDANLIQRFTNTSELVHMNWGWNGTYNGFYSFLPENWETSNGHYEYNIKMLYDFNYTNQ